MEVAVCYDALRAAQIAQQMALRLRARADALGEIAARASLGEKLKGAGDDG